MEQLLLSIVEALRAGQQVDDKLLSHLVRQANSGVSDVSRHVSKKKALPFYLKIKEQQTSFWRSLDLDDDLETRLIAALRAKPRRTSSGVATVTVITKPYPCGGCCIFCPNDIRMPKSYLSDEPACRRAERNFFDPYLQMASRIHTLEQMGHVTDKVEVIILGGTWCDYPREYQTWFIYQLFAALNDSDDVRKRKVAERLKMYRALGLDNSDEALAAQFADEQHLVDSGQLSYNEAWSRICQQRKAYASLTTSQTATIEEVFAQHEANSRGTHRVVGLVVETRPETITPQALTLIRQLGCTKVQIGVQSLDERILAGNGRGAMPKQVAQAFELLRLFGFKIHAHFMANLYGADLDGDLDGYRHFVGDEPYQPDEVKLYPCALIGSTELMNLYESGEWSPYNQQELTRLLVGCMQATPAFTRVSRMIRDFSAQDIVVGVKKTNLRQDVDDQAANGGSEIVEIRTREIDDEDVDLSSLSLKTIAYETPATSERFLQWVTASNKIAGFLRLSLPKESALQRWDGQLPIGKKEAMIREVHVYGKVSAIGLQQPGAQHMGLGKKLIARAEEIALKEGYERINVISAIGTRGYYESLGFERSGFYHSKRLNGAKGNNKKTQ